MIDVLIIAHNEAVNLTPCLAALRGWTNKIFVIDSGSTDGSQELARSLGAEVVHHDWEGYAHQKNWGLRTLPLEADWTLIVDADEVITDGVRERLVRIASRPVKEVPENGFFINRITYFLDRPIRHCGYFPSWNLRFFKRGRGFYEDREVHEHVMIDDPVGYIKEAMIHDDRRGLEHYIAKHNRYSTLEARSLYAEITEGTQPGPTANVSRQTRRRRWLKQHIMPRVPVPGLWRFLFMYFIRFGILDGRAGFEFCRFISTYDYMVALKLRALRKATAVGSISPDLAGSPVQGLAVPEGADRAVIVPSLLEKTRSPRPTRAAKVKQRDSGREDRPRIEAPAESESPFQRFGNLVEPGLKVIVTGGSGFIGTNVVEYYHRCGAEVINIDCSPPRHPDHAALWQDIDLRDYDRLRGVIHDFKPQIVQHLGARTDLDESNDLRGYGGNMEGNENILRAVEGLDSLDRMVITSTMLVCRPDHDPRSDTDYSPHTLYGMSKVVTESQVRGWTDAPCPWVMVRPTSIWGPWFHQPYRGFFTSIARRLYFHQRGYDPLRSFGFVGNCVYQYVMLTKAPLELIQGKTFYMADYEPIRIREWANLIQEEMGIKSLHEIPYGVLKVAAKIGDGCLKLGWKRPPLTSFRLSNLTSDNVNDTSGMERAVGELPYSLEEGVRITVKWLRDEGLIAPAPNHPRTTLTADQSSAA